jgi:hypothetical protein
MTLVSAYTVFSLDREEEARDTLVRIRRVPETDDRIRLELLEIKAAALFDKETTAVRYPDMAGFRLSYERYKSLFTVRHLNRRMIVACLLQIIQQFTGTIRHPTYKRTRLTVSRYQRNHLLCPSDLPKDWAVRKLDRSSRHRRCRSHQLLLYNPRHHVHGPLGSQESSLDRCHWNEHLSVHRGHHLRRLQGFSGRPSICRLGFGCVHLDLHFQLCL